MSLDHLSDKVSDWSDEGNTCGTTINSDGGGGLDVDCNSKTARYVLLCKVKPMALLNVAVYETYVPCTPHTQAEVEFTSSIETESVQSSALSHNVAV